MACYAREEPAITTIRWPTASDVVLLRCLADRPLQIAQYGVEPPKAVFLRFHDFRRHIEEAEPPFPHKVLEPLNDAQPPFQVSGLGQRHIHVDGAILPYRD
jgi:hypothetical protein